MQEGQLGLLAAAAAAFAPEIWLSGAAIAHRSRAVNPVTNRAHGQFYWNNWGDHRRSAAFCRLWGAAPSRSTQPLRTSSRARGDRGEGDAAKGAGRPRGSQGSIWAQQLRLKLR